MAKELSIQNVADWFIDNGKDITPKKLQKMLYYAYAWALVFFNDDQKDLRTKLFDGNFEAWVHGPVNRKIYAEYRDYGYGVINPESKSDEQVISDDVLDLLKQINEIYGPYNGNELERLTHSESPWINARGDAKPLDSSTNKLSDEDMFDFYGKKLIA